MIKKAEAVKDLEDDWIMRFSDQLLQFGFRALCRSDLVGDLNLVWFSPWGAGALP
jgi:hypothetical protein